MENKNVVLHHTIWINHGTSGTITCRTNAFRPGGQNSVPEGSEAKVLQARMYKYIYVYVLMYILGIV